METGSDVTATHDERTPPSLIFKTSWAESGNEQTSCFMSTIPQLPVTLTVKVLRAAWPWSHLYTPGGEATACTRNLHLSVCLSGALTRTMFVYLSAWMSV